MKGKEVKKIIDIITTVHDELVGETSKTTDNPAETLGMHMGIAMASVGIAHIIMAQIGVVSEITIGGRTWIIGYPSGPKQKETK